MPFSVLPREKVTCRPDTRLMRLSQVEAACLWSPATQLLPWLRPGCFILSMNDREKALYYANWWKIYTFYTYTHTGLSVTWPWPRHHLKIYYWMGWESMIPFKFFSPTSDSTPNASETAAWSAALCFYIWHCSHPCSATFWRVKSSAVVERGRKVRGWLGWSFTFLSETWVYVLFVTKSQQWFLFNLSDVSRLMYRH